MRFGVRSLRLQVAGVGFRVWNLGFGVLGFRCGVQEFRVEGFVVEDNGKGEERCPPRQTSRVERLKAKVASLFNQVIVDV